MEAEQGQSTLELCSRPTLDQQAIQVVGNLSDAITLSLQASYTQKFIAY